MINPKDESEFCVETEIKENQKKIAKNNSDNSDFSDPNSELTKSELYFNQNNPKLSSIAPEPGGPIQPSTDEAAHSENKDSHQEWPQNNIQTFLNRRTQEVEQGRKGAIQSGWTG